MKETLERLYEHVFWANDRVFELLGTNVVTDPKPLQLLAHLLSAETVWLARLQGSDTNNIPIWPDFTIDECAVLFETNRRSYRNYLDQLTEQGTRQIISYKNSRGKQFRTAVGDILLHVALHGSYHRGQIAGLIRADGSVPVNTDFITFTREEAS